MWLGTYELKTPGVEVGDNATVILDTANTFQPDYCLLVLPEFGGRIEFTDKMYVEGSPELVVEVSVSTVSLDLNRKKNAYQRNGVNEYIVWRVEDEEIDWFVLNKGQYQPSSADKDGITRSNTFPGLWLDRTALLQRNFDRVLNVLELGVKSDEHNRFVSTLKRK